MNIEEGKCYRCIEDVELASLGIRYIKDKLYRSKQDDYLIDEFGVQHCWKCSELIKACFVRVYNKRKRYDNKSRR